MDIQKMMQQAQQVQARMQEMQGRMAEMEVNGAAGGGMVKVTANCKGELLALKIDPSIVDPEDVEMMEDLIKAAINEARVNAENLIGSETQKMMKELGLPANGGGGMPF